MNEEKLIREKLVLESKLEESKKIKNIKNISVDLTVKLIGYNAYCFKCSNLFRYGEEKEILEAMELNLDTMVLKDCFCENCSCNTFDIDVYFKVESNIK